MGTIRDKTARKVALAASAALLAVALPTSVFAVGLLGDNVALGNASQFAFTPASADPDVAELIAERNNGQTRMLRFTPAGAAASRAERSVTVAVRIDQQTAQAIAASSAIGSARNNSATSGLRVAPVRYNLGIARGFASFAQSPSQLAARPISPVPAAGSTALSRSLSEADIPDLAAFEPRAGIRQEESRFAARVEMDEQRAVAARDARESVGDQLLDVGGSYRLTRNLDITAGVRYEQDRDIVPLPDVDQQDSQAVYIGTQFRF